MPEVVAAASGGLQFRPGASIHGPEPSLRRDYRRHAQDLWSRRSTAEKGFPPPRACKMYPLEWRAFARPGAFPLVSRTLAEFERSTARREHLKCKEVRPCASKPEDHRQSCCRTTLPTRRNSENCRPSRWIYYALPWNAASEPTVRPQLRGEFRAAFPPDERSARPRSAYARKHRDGE